MNTLPPLARLIRRYLVATLTSFMVVTTAAGDVSFDELVEVESARVGQAYINPDADFSVYRRVKILEPYVSFRRNWRRDTDRASTRRLRDRDVERIKERVAELFAESFRDRLEADDGYEIVSVTGDDVLLLRPAIINLDIKQPDTIVGGRDRFYTATAGSATLYIELYDSTSGAILGRALDRKATRNPSVILNWSNNVTNEAEARRAFGAWAQILRDFLDSHYVPANAYSD